jgi:Pentapeptide repeats (8 copies)
MIEIIHRSTSAVLYKSETATTVAAALVQALKEGAHLEGAYLEGAYLRGAYLLGVNLRGANLGGVNLGGVNLEGAYLRGADLGGAYLGGANLRDAYLEGAKGLLSKPIAPLQIGGSRHWIIVRQDGYLTIGCRHKPLAEWEAHYEAIGRSEGYSDAEVQEYALHIAHCRAWMEMQGVVEPIKEAA